MVIESCLFVSRFKNLFVLACSVALVVSESLRPCGLEPTRLLCPWDSLGKNTGVGCHVLLQGMSPAQESTWGLLHCRWILYQLSYQGSPETCKGGLLQINSASIPVSKLFLSPQNNPAADPSSLLLSPALLSHDMFSLTLRTVPTEDLSWAPVTPSAYCVAPGPVIPCSLRCLLTRLLTP